MDAIPLPLPKKLNFTRASPAQVKVLKAGFAVSNLSSPEHLTALSEATGLTTKWITSWFTRERKKCSITVPRFMGPTKAEPVSTTAMSLGEVSTFKTEHQDTPIPPTGAATSDGMKTDRKHVVASIPQSKAARKPRRRGNNPNISPSPLRSPFVSAPLVPRSAPLDVPLPDPFVPTRSDPASSHSAFILRPLVPMMYKPDISQSISLLSCEPAPSDSTQIALTSTSTSGDLNPSFSVIKCTYDTRTTSDPTNLTSGRRITTQLASSPPSNIGEQGNHDFNTNTAGLNSRKPPSVLFEQRPKPSQSGREGDRRSRLRPLLPLHGATYINSSQTVTQRPSHPYRPQAPLSWSAPIQNTGDQHIKENQPPILNPFTKPSPRSADLSPPLSTQPVFAPPISYHNTFASKTDIPQQQPSGYPFDTVSPLQAYSLQPLSWPQNQVQAMTQTPVPPADFFSMLFDPAAAPLKHLDVLTGCQSADDMMYRLLDERLAQEDPFQAAMGLSFMSGLGVEWDFS